MEEAIVDNALDLNLPPADCSLQPGVQEDIFTESRDQASPLTHGQQDCQTAQAWPLNRGDRVEILRQSVCSGAYHVDSTELAQCIWQNSTRFLETSLASAETDSTVTEAS